MVYSLRKSKNIILKQMADSSVKKVQITGGAAETYMTGTRKAKKRTPRGLPIGKLQEGGDSSGALVQLVANKVPALPTTTAAEPVGVTEQKGGAESDKSVKVILEPPKKKTRKVILAPPKKIIKVPGPPTQTSAPVTSVLKKTPSKTKTHKVARRIRVSVDGLSKRINRAKTIKKDSQKMPIEQIKKQLIESGLIKKESKAPEPILRQMYNDFETLKQRAL